MNVIFLSPFQTFQFEGSKVRCFFLLSQKETPVAWENITSKTVKVYPDGSDAIFQTLSQSHYTLFYKKRFEALKFLNFNPFLVPKIS